MALVMYMYNRPSVGSYKISPKSFEKFRNDPFEVHLDVVLDYDPSGLDPLPRLTHTNSASGSHAHVPTNRFVKWFAHWL